MERQFMKIWEKDYEKEEIEQAISRVDWEPFRRENLPFCQGEAIKTLVIECNIPLSKITRMSLHGVIKGSHGFYGLDVDYKNARVQLYIVDNGCSCGVCAADVWEKQTV